MGRKTVSAFRGRSRRCGATILALSLSLGCAYINGQSPARETSKPTPDRKFDDLLVYGDGFLFSAREPDGWHGDTEEIARHYNSNLIFLPDDRNRAAHVNIRIRLNRKETKDPSEDMQTDMTGYRKKYPDVKFADLAVSHPKYKICAKLFYFEKDYYEYVVYVDPGPDAKMNFSVVMSKESEPATPEELKTFQAILGSLSWISGVTVTP